MVFQRGDNGSSTSLLWRCSSPRPGRTRGRKRERLDKGTKGGARIGGRTTGGGEEPALSPPSATREHRVLTEQMHQGPPEERRSPPVAEEEQKEEKESQNATEGSHGYPGGRAISLGIREDGSPVQLASSSQISHHFTILLDVRAGTHLRHQGLGHVKGIPPYVNY